jgi:hypothetical protein
MDREAIRQVLTQRIAELDEVEKRLEAVRVDMQKQRLLKEEIRILQAALNDGAGTSFYDEPDNTKPRKELLIDAVRRVLGASSVPMSAPQISERLRKEGRQFKKSDRTGTNSVRSLLMGYGEKARESRRCFRRIQRETDTVYELIKKDDGTGMSPVRLKPLGPSSQRKE